MVGAGAGAGEAGEAAAEPAAEDIKVEEANPEALEDAPQEEAKTAQ